MNFSPPTLWLDIAYQRRPIRQRFQDSLGPKSTSISIVNALLTKLFSDSFVLHFHSLSKRRNTIAPPTQSSKLSGCGESYLEPRSAPVRYRTHKGNRPAHLAHAPRDDRQPQSGPARLGRKERLENFILHRRRHAYAVVGDGDGKTALAVRGACDLHLAAAPVGPVEPVTFDRLQCVEEQVEQNLLERGDLLSVKFRVGPQIGRDGDRAPLGLGPAERQHALD